MVGRTIVFPKMLLTVTSPSFSYSSISIRRCTWDKVHPVSPSSLFAFVPLMDPSDTGNLPSCRVFLGGLWSWVQSWHRGSGWRCDQTSGTQNTLGRGLCPTSLGHSTFSRLSSPLWPFVPPGQGVRAVSVRSIASLPVSMELPGLGLYHEPIGKVGASQLRRIMSSGRIPLPYPQHGWARSMHILPVLPSLFLSVPAVPLVHPVQAVEPPHVRLVRSLSLRRLVFWPHWPAHDRYPLPSSSGCLNRLMVVLHLHDHLSHLGHLQRGLRVYS